MMSAPLRSILAVAAASALLAGCGGGGSGGAPPTQSTGGGTSATQSVTVTLKVPGSGIAGSVRRPAYVSRNTRGIGFRFALDPHTFPATRDALASPTYAASISPNAGGCGSANTDGSFSCTLQIPNVPAGTVDFQIGTWDAAPAGSAPYFPNAHILATNVINGIAVSSTMSPFNISLDPVVDSVQLSTTLSTLIQGTAKTGTLNVYAKDAQGNIIVGGDQFVDNGGNLISINLSVTDPSSVVTLSGYAIASAAQSPLTITYNGGNESAACACVSFSAASTLPLAGSLLGTTIPFTSTGGGVTIPGAPQVSKSVAAAQPYLDIAAGNDGNLYAASPYTGSVVVFAPGVPPVLQTSIPTGGSSVATVAIGADGDVWYAENSAGNTYTVSKFAPAATFAPVTTATITGVTTMLRTGPDGLMYSANGAAGTLDVIAPSSMNVRSYPIQTAGADPQVLAPVPGNGAHHPLVCFGESVEKIGCFDVVTKAMWGEYALPSGEIVYGMVAGPDGLLYIGTTAHLIRSFTLNGSLLLSKTYTVTDVPFGLTVAADGNIWFTEPLSTSEKLGRLTIPKLGAAPVVSEYNTETGIAANAAPLYMVSGKDGNLYFTDAANNQVDEVTP